MFKDNAYPETGAGGFTRFDGTIQFYMRVNALLRPDMEVLDLGAGRGAQFEMSAGTIKQSLIGLKGKVARLVGADVDPVVMTNPYLDEAVVFDPSKPLPFADQTFDLVLCDWVLEHIEDSESFAREVGRILRPGGWLCARTPNRWGLTALMSSLIPNSMHTKALNRLTPHRKDEDVFETHYRLNTRGKLRRYFPAFQCFSYVYNSEPPYVRNVPVLAGLVRLYWRLMPEALYTVLMVFLRKAET